MPIVAAARSTIKIGGTTARTDAAGYNAETWVAIGNVEDLGEVGSEAEIIIAKTLESEFVKKIKGSRDNGTLELVVLRDSADVGYVALLAAEKSAFGYNFAIELNDKPAAGASPKNSRFYFNAIVGSARNSLNGADDLVRTTFALAISGPVLEVAASAT